MTQQIIDIGVQGNDGTGDSIRTSFQKVNSNFNELYAIFGAGGTIRFTNLSDAPSTYSANQIIMADTTGGSLSARTIVAGTGIGITTSDPTKITIAALSARLNNDPSPTLSASINANQFSIGNLGDPSQQIVDDFNALYASQNITTTIGQLAVTKNYADNNYVGTYNGVVAKALRIREEPATPQTSDIDYDATLTSNYVSTEAMQRKHTVYRGGDTMTGKLNLNDHPGSMAGAGTPNGADDLQAATKFYVDNNTNYSTTNLYVKTNGDDLQTRTPAGREGRAWQYAYKTVGAAALQAQNLIALSSIEPGPYRQRIAYTIGPTQTFSTIQSITLTGGNSGIVGYTDAAAILEANKSFIQAETIAYLNKKYVNTFTFDKSRWASIISNIVDAVGYDTVLGTNFNSTTQASILFNAYNSDILSNNLTQIIDAVNYAKNQVLNFSYSTANTQTYLGQVIDAILYDMIFGSNLRSIQVARNFNVAATGLDTAATIVNTSTVNTTSVTNTVTVLSTLGMIVGSPITFTGTSFGNIVSGTTYYIQSIVDSANIKISLSAGGSPFVLTTHAGIMSVSTTGPSQVSATLSDLANTITSDASFANLPSAVTSIQNSIALIQGIIAGGSLPAVVFGALPTTNDNSTFTFDQSKCSRDVGIIVNAVLDDLIFGTNYRSITAAFAYIRSYSSVVTSSQKAQTIAGLNFARDEIIGLIPTNTAAIAAITASMSVITTIINNVSTSGAPSITWTYNNPTAGINISAQQLQNNRQFLIDETIAYINANLNPGSISMYNEANCRRDTGYIIDAITFDLIYSGNTATVAAADAYFTGTNVNTISTELSSVTSAYTHLNSVIASVIPGTLYSRTTGNTTVQSTSAGTGTATAAASTLVTNVITIINGGVASGPTLVVPTYANGTTYAANSSSRTIILNGLSTVQANVILFLIETYQSNVGVTSARDLLLNNLSFIQAEIVAFLLVNYPTLSYSSTTCQRDVKFIVWSLIYDFMYGGNSQSVYAGLQYWIGNTLQIASYEQTATIASINYINTLCQAIINNVSPSTVYQQSVYQYINQTLGNANIVSTSIANNITTIAGIVGSVSTPTPTLYAPTTSNASSTLNTARLAILAEKATIESTEVTYVNSTFSVINNTIISSTITSLFNGVTSLLTNGIASRTTPTFVDPSSLVTTTAHARSGILANISFIAADTIAWINLNYPSLVYSSTTCSRDITYLLEAICYDLTYGGNSGTLQAALQYWYAGTRQIANAEVTATVAAITHAQSLAIAVSSNSSVTRTSGNQVTQTFNSVWADGSAAASTINGLFNTVTDIIANDTVYSQSLPDLTTYASIPQAAQVILHNNKTTIANATNVYLSATYPGGFNYNEATCYRDLGYIIDAMVIDILTGGTYQSINAGKSYYKNASAKAIAIGTQLTETLDGITFAKNLGLQVLNKTTQTRFQSLVTQITNTYSPSAPAIATFTTNMNTLISIITTGYGAAPTPTFGTGLYSITFDNGGNGYVDQGQPGDSHIIPAKVLVGANSNAFGQIVTYTPGQSNSYDTITVRMVRPGFFQLGEQLDFGETVPEQHITIYVESGIYYEDYPIKLSANVTIAGDDFRRTIIRPRDRISQSPWRSVFFYRDSVIDGIQTGIINYSGVDYAAATGSTLTLSGTTGNITATLGTGQAPSSWLGLVVTDSTSGSGTPGKAVVSTISGNVLNLTVIYPFAAVTTYAAGSWHMYGTINYGRHYLTNPLDITSTPLNNKLIDVFLCNDATRIRLISMQGHGGFAMVLDPEGQIKTKSPYAQESGSFSQSINYKRFAGGQFIDGFTGRLFGTITNVAQNLAGVNGTQLTVVGSTNSGLDVRAPQTPCAFYIQGNRFQVNDVVSFNAATATVVLTIDTGTPFYPPNFYNTSTFTTSLGSVIDNIGIDMVTGSNYKSLFSGYAYLFPQNSLTILATLFTTQGLAYINSNLGSVSSAGKASIATSLLTISNMLNNGVTTVPATTFPIPSGVSGTANIVKALNTLQANRTFLQQEVSAWIAATYNVNTIPNYNAVKSQRDTGFIIDAICYDILYGGNSAIYDVSLSYYGSGVSQILGEESYCVAAYGHLNTIMQQVVQNQTVSKAAGNPYSQNTSLPAATSAEATIINTEIGILSDYVADGVFTNPTTRTTPTSSSWWSSQTEYADYGILQGLKSTLLSGAVSYLNSGAGLGINIEMGGNKSMLANDFTQINDLGYGVFATNGGLTEQVSTFSYYCYTGYWANNGGQVRSIAGSNSHGVYGLRATGYDVTELPDSVNLAYDMVQVARVYKQGEFINAMTPTQSKQAVTVYVTGYAYLPFGSSELEIDHSVQGGGIVRYLISTIAHTDVTINGKNILSITLSTSGTDSTSSTGLQYALYDGQTVTIRVLQDIKFLNIDNVKPVRPSTALQYIDNLSEIYRVVAYNLTEATGETLGANISVLQTDSSFAYYKFVSDGSNITQLDPSDSTKTQGSKVGDNKIAVLTISSATTVNQINKGTYIVGWGGRTHRVISYTQPTTISTGLFVSYTVTSGPTYTLVVNGVAGTISQGQILTSTGSSTGFNGTQTVTSVIITSPGGVATATITLSGPATVNPPTGTVTFGVATNGYLSIDPNPLSNLASDGTLVNAMTYVSSVAQTGSTTAKIVTFNIPYIPSAQLPAVDSYLTVTSNSNSNYNGTKQITSIVNTTQLTVSSTASLSVGMVVSSTSTGAYVPTGTIIQSIDSTTQFTVSPSCWIPAGSIVSSSLVATVQSITITNGGSGYTTAPTITFSGGSATSQAIATVSIANGAIVAYTLVSPGYGYTSTPTITITPALGGAILTPVLTTTATITTTASAGNNTVTMGLLYPTDPGVNSNVTATTNGTVSATGKIAGTVLSLTNVASGTPSLGMVLSGTGVTAGTYISAVNTASFVGNITSTTTLTIVSGTTPSIGMVLVGAGIPSGTYIASGTGPFTLSAAASNGTNIGIVGTSYTVSASQTVNAGTAISGLLNALTVASTTGLNVGQQISFSGTAFGTGSILTPFNGITPNIIYYINRVVGTYIGISTTLGGNDITLTSGSVSVGTALALYTPNYGYGTSYAINASTGFTSKTIIGSGPTYSVVLNFSTTTAPTTGKYYLVSGNGNPLYNGYYLCTASSSTTITLTYLEDPGTWNTGYATTVTLEVTNGSGNTLGIGRPFNTINNATLRVGRPAGAAAQITTRISTCRATGHDFLDIGTGGYVTTNYPVQIYGNPAIQANSANQVLEETVGRVFYVTTDENGIFRVGRFFSVDQGTGTVTFSASIALSNLDGLGFKRGVVVTEFSTDPTMTDNAPDIVPVQSAIRSFIDNRLGLDYGGSPVATTSLIGPGYLALNGTLAMKGNLNLGNFSIGNVTMPTTGTSKYDGANRDYVDQSLVSLNSFYKLLDVGISAAKGTYVSGSSISYVLTVNNISGTIVNGLAVYGTGFNGTQTVQSVSVNAGVATVTLGSYPNSNPSGTIFFLSPVAGGSFLVYDAGLGKWKNVTAPTGDLAITYNSGTGAITTSINAGVITNAGISSSAAIAQNKLAMNAATTRVNYTGITQANLGLASFNSSSFSSTSGWIDLLTSTSPTTGITYNKIQQMSAGTLLGNLTSGAASPSEITPSQIISSANGIVSGSFAASGAMIVGYDGSNTANNTYGVVSITTTRGANSLVKSGPDGSVDVANLKVGGFTVLSTSGATVEFSTPGGIQQSTPFYYMTAVGTTGSNTTITTQGTLDTSNGTLIADTLTSGSPATSGSMEGQWYLTASSQFDFSLGILKSNNLTAGSSTAAGTIDGNWNLTTGSQLRSTYADLAEFYEGDKEYPEGWVLVFGGEKEVTSTTTFNDTRLAGVVTTNPAYVMNEGQKGIKVCLALAGRIPCRVVGKVKKGDLLTTSAVEGCAVKATNPQIGSIVGKAIQDKDYDSVGVIEVAVGRA